MRIRCPQCSQAIEAAPGEVVRCQSCGFEGPAPGVPAPKASAPEGKPAVAVARDPVTFSAFAYLLSLVSVATFFLAPFGVPVLLGLAGAGLGAWSLSKDRKDVRAMIAIGAGILGSALGVWLFA